MDYCNVIDNFLPEDEFSILANSISGMYFPWFYSDGKVYDGDGYDQFYHMFYNFSTGVKSDHISLIQPLLKKMGSNQIYKAKVNMNLKRIFNRKTRYHIDMENVTTAIFYISTNNGGTKFKGGPFIKSEANRIVFFNSNIMHRGICCSDEKKRLVININYM